ncbi:transposase [Azospirillum griseum]|uniref:Transposase n=1 Tax=Azospirillum griseum TaxID=2496639 RepID=A0A3S0R4W3_9PROT|nr:transposase [Azospirillum griseum]
MAGSERRRHYTEAEKLRLIEAAFRPGVMVSEAARRFGVHESLLYRWRRQREGRSFDRPLSGFIGVTVTPSAPPPDDGGLQTSSLIASAPKPPTSEAAVEVTLGGDVRVRIPAATSPELAASVIAALMGSRSRS